MAASGESVLPNPAQPVAIPRADFAVWAITAATAVLHLAVAQRYDIFRNELYFIVCGRHPAFGYVDQPPLVPLLAAATQLFGDSVWLLRLPAAAAAVALVPLSAYFARLAGGGRVSIVLAALAVALSPALAGVTSTTTTATFEPLAWTAVACLVAQAVLREDRRALLWAGLVTGLSMEAKYGIAMWLIPLAAGLLLTDARRILAWRELWLGVAAAVVLAAPSIIWQTLHGWPFLEVVREHSTTYLNGSPLAFILQQIVAINLLLAPLWLAGVICPFVTSSLKPLRFLAIAFVGATVLDVVTGGKDYYLFAAYPTMFAVGGAACAHLNRYIAGIWLALCAAVFAALAPLALPLMDPPSLARYEERTHLRPKPDELAAVGAPLTQVFSDEMPWRDLEKQVASIYHSLPQAEQKQAAIVATNYGEAAAIDFYGRHDGLPPVLSGQNQYYLWGPHGYDGAVIIHVNGDPRVWRRYCERLEVAATFGAPYAMPYENGRPIMVCHGLRGNLTQTWERFKRYR
jgi:hypothetical protein